MGNEMRIVERIREEAVRSGRSIARLEREAGLGNGTIRKWNENIPSAEKLAKVAEILGKSMDFLYYGHDRYTGLDSEEAAIMDYYRSVPKEKKDRLRGYLKGFADGTTLL